MDAKLSITTRCNATCKTCPVWQYKGSDMTFDNFVIMWDKLNASPFVDKILLNSTGDMYIHSDRKRIFNYIEENKNRYVTMTTNASDMDRVPKINEMIISFNGTDKESYEYTTGLDFDKVVGNIKKYHDQIMGLDNAEIHCLIWDGNKDAENKILEIFDFWKGRIRISFKYDNQFKEDKTLDRFKADHRIPCDYLSNLTIMPNGDVISCAHDFKGENVFNNILDNDINNENEKRVSMWSEHIAGIYTGLCEKCNYNTPIEDGKIFYIKERTC